MEIQCRTVYTNMLVVLTACKRLRDVACIRVRECLHGSIDVLLGDLKLNDMTLMSVSG